MEYKGIEFVKYNASPEKEKHSAPYKALEDAVVLVPKGAELSESALTTIRHLRYYQNGHNVTLLLSDSAGVLLDPAGFADIIESAECVANAVCGNMPDFAPYPMDDGGSIVLMQEAAFGFRPYALANSGGFPAGALEVRRDIMMACDEFRVLAVVYNNAADFEEYNK